MPHVPLQHSTPEPQMESFCEQHLWFTHEREAAVPWQQSPSWAQAPSDGMQQLAGLPSSEMQLAPPQQPPLKAEQSPPSAMQQVPMLQP
jgi:hypothetical protein